MKESFFLALSNDQNIHIIDLHKSESIADALEQLEKGLFFVFKKGDKYCKVIYGIGAGVLRKEVLNALENNPIIKEFREGEGNSIALF